MDEAKEQAEQAEQTFTKETDEATWQRPDHVVVETALEVTGYSLSSR